MIWNRRRPDDKGHTVTIEPVTSFAEPPDDAEEPEVMDRLVRVNVKLLLATLVVLIVAATGVHFLHGFWVQRNADSLLERADVAEEEGRYSDAISSLTQYLNLQPQASLSEEKEQQITDVTERLAQLLQKQKVTRNQQLRLYRTFEDVLRRDPTRRDTRRQLIDVCMRLRLYRDAVRHIDTLIEQPKQGEPVSEQTTAELLKLKGDCLQVLEEYRNAAIAYAQSIATDPENPRNYAPAAGLALRHPDAMPSRDELAGKANWAGPFVQTLADAFPNKTDSRSNWGTATPLKLIDQMVEVAEPQWLAQLLKSEFLLGTVSREDAPPLEEKLARSRAEAIFNELDADEDGFLSEAEANHESMPVLTDTDDDGRIEMSELVTRLTRGDQLARLEAALAAANEAVALAERVDSPEVLTRTLRNAAEVNLALANAALLNTNLIAGKYHTAARRLLERALKTNDADPQIYLSLARLERQQVGTGMDPEDLRSHLQRSEQHLRAGLAIVEETLADENAEDGVKESGDEGDSVDLRASETELLWSLADTLVALSQLGDDRDGLLAEVRAMIPRIEESGAQELLTDFLEAQLLIAGEQWRAALNVLTPLSTMELNTALDRRVALLRSRCLQKLEIPDSAVSLFADQIQNDPLWIEGRTELARAMLSSGQMQRAIDEYRRIVTAPGVAENLARLLLIQQSSLPAERRDVREAERMIGLIPDESAAERSMLTAELQLLRGRTLAQKAAAATTEADKQQLNERAVAQLEAASSTLQDSIADHPDNAELRAAYATLLLQRFDRPVADRLAAAERYLQESVEDIGDQVPFRLSAAQASVALPKEQAIASLAELETDMDKFSDEDQQSLLTGLARAYATVGDVDRAIALWQMVASADPRAIEPRLAILQLIVMARQQTDVEVSIDDKYWNRTLNEVREIETSTATPAESESSKQSQAPNADYFEAAQLILDAAGDGKDKATKLKTAQSLLERARRFRPMWSAIPRALGDIEVMRGNRELAIEHYEKAFSLGDRAPRMIGRIAQHYYSQLTEEGVERAGRLMDELRAENPNLISDDLAQLQWRISWRRSQYDDALNVLKSLASRSEGLEDRLRWVWAQLLTGQQTEDIEQLLEELANDYGSESPEVWRVWVAYLVQAGRTDDALPVIEQAKKKLPDDPPHVRPLAIASYLELLRVKDDDTLKQLRAETERYYRLALESAPDSTTVALPMARYYIATQQFEQARPLLEGILNSPDSPEPARDWARRNQALIVASSGRFDDTTRALEMISSISDHTTATDLRVQLAILARRSAGIDRPRKIQILESLRGTDRLTAPELLQLAKLYNSEGKWETAKANFEELLKSQPNDRGAAAEYALAAIRNDDLDLASSLADRVDELAPGTLLAASTRARLLAGKDQGEAAAQVLRDYLESLTKPTEDSADPELRKSLKNAAMKGPDAVAELLDMFEEYVTTTAPANGRSTLSRAQALAGDGDPEQACLTVLQYLLNNDVTIALYVDQVRVVATLLEEIGQEKAAEPLYEEYARLSTRPEALLLWAAHLGRQNRTDEAFEVLEQAWDKADHLQVLRYSVALNRHGGLRETEVSKIRKWLQQVRSEQPGSPQSLLYWADFADSQADYDTEERLYRQIIEEHPDQSIIAMNNLAYLLALRGNRTDEALELVDRAIQIAGPQPSLLETRAVVYLKKGSLQQAVSNLKQAVQQSATATNQFLLAAALAQSGEISAAEQAYRDALAAGFSAEKLHPLDRELHTQLLALLPEDI